MFVVEPVARGGAKVFSHPVHANILSNLLKLMHAKTPLKRGNVLNSQILTISLHVCMMRETSAEISPDL